MADTYIGTNDPKAVKLFSIMLFADNIRASRMLRMFSESSGKITQRMSMAKREANADHTRYADCHCIRSIESSEGTE